MKKLSRHNRPRPDVWRTLPDGFKFEPLGGLTLADKNFICRALGMHAALTATFGWDPKRTTLEQRAEQNAGLIARAAIGSAPSDDAPAPATPETTSPFPQST